jgi:hypothetical protein
MEFSVRPIDNMPPPPGLIMPASSQLQPRTLALVCCLGLCCAMIGPVAPRSAAAPRSAPAPQPVKAWFDARSVCIFPLAAGSLPKSRDELGSSLANGYQHALRVPDSGKLVQIHGESYPALDSLRIDLSDSSMPAGIKSEKIKPNNKPLSRVGVGNFDLVGNPLLCNDAKLNLHVHVADAQLDLEHDRGGKPIMLLADARDASLQFDAKCDDLQQILLTDLRAAASPYGLEIVSTTLHLTADSDHSVSVDLHLLTKFAMIPAGMTFRAHVDIDDQMYAKLTGLSCDGDHVLGPLIVGLLRPGLAKYEGKSRPLLSFPSPAMRLRTVQIKVDDRVHLTAGFGS